MEHGPEVRLAHALVEVCDKKRVPVSLSRTENNSPDERNAREWIVSSSQTGTHPMPSSFSPDMFFKPRSRSFLVCGASTGKHQLPTHRPHMNPPKEKQKKKKRTHLIRNLPLPQQLPTRPHQIVRPAHDRQRPPTQALQARVQRRMSPPRMQHPSVRLLVRSCARHSRRTRGPRRRARRVRTRLEARARGHEG